MLFIRNKKKARDERVNSEFSTLFFFGFNEEKNYVFWLFAWCCSVSHLVVINKNACTINFLTFMLNEILRLIGANQRHRSLCT
jgi:hypothetical protein